MRKEFTGSRGYDFGGHPVNPVNPVRKIGLEYKFETFFIFP